MEDAEQAMADMAEQAVKHLEAVKELYKELYGYTPPELETALEASYELLEGL